jgi:transposase-like protein
MKFNIAQIAMFQFGNERKYDMKCPVCKSTRSTSHFNTPVIMGGRNSISHYTCDDCGVMFVATENNPSDPENYHGWIPQFPPMFPKL